MAAQGYWKVKPGRTVYNKRQTVKAQAGETLTFDDEDARRNPAAVVLVFEEQERERIEKAAEEAEADAKAEEADAERMAARAAATGQPDPPELPDATDATRFGGGSVIERGITPDDDQGPTVRPGKWGTNS